MAAGAFAGIAVSLGREGEGATSMADDRAGALRDVSDRSTEGTHGTRISVCEENFEWLTLVIDTDASRQPHTCGDIQRHWQRDSDHIKS